MNRNAIEFGIDAKTEAERLAAMIGAIKDRRGDDLYSIGVALIEAKRLLPHGMWLAVLRDQRVAFGDRQAQNFMAIARADDGRELAKFGVAKATLLLNLNLERRKQLISEGGVEYMSASELRGQINELTGKARPRRSASERKVPGAVLFAAGVLHLSPAKICNEEAIEEAYSELAKIFQIAAENGEEHYLIILNDARTFLLRMIYASSTTRQGT